MNRLLTLLTASPREVPGQLRLKNSGASVAPFGRADFLLLITLTLLAAVLRLYALGDVPQGIHGDEAQVGTEARRVLETGWIGPYTPAALGQPSGHAYLTAPSIALFGNTPWSVRLPLALMGVAATPLTFVLFRLLASRLVASLAAFLLATSLWHIHFSRVAHWPISYVTIGLIVLVLWTMAMQSGRWPWFVAAGAVLGLGLYTYNVYPVFVFAFTLWVAAYTLVFKRGASFLPWARNVGLAAFVAFLVGIPLFAYILEPSNDYFGHYRDYGQFSIFSDSSFKNAGIPGKAEIAGHQLWHVLSAYVIHGKSDYIDASMPDGRPMLDHLTVALIIVGAVLAGRRWRKVPNLLALMLSAAILLTTATQTNAVYRAPLGIAPFLSFLAALPLAQVVEYGRRTTSLRPFVYGICGLLCLFIAYTNVHSYFGPWRNSDLFPWVYAQQISAASEYAQSLPDKPYVYFYSGRWSFDYETRHYLAPDVRGEDRSTEFGRFDLNVDRSHDSLILLLPPYTDVVDQVKALYPGVEPVTRSDRGKTLFIAFRIPKR